MFVPENPILLPRPKRVTCPKCDESWIWRTWYKGSKRATCSRCKISVVPIPSEEKSSRLIKCPYCGRFQWYSGDKKKTSCTNSDCGKKNITVREISKEELMETLEKHKYDFSEEEDKYYDNILSEM